MNPQNIKEIEEINDPTSPIFSDLANKYVNTAARRG